MAIAARKQKFKGLIVAEANMKEAAIVNQLPVWCKNLRDVFGFQQFVTLEPYHYELRKLSTMLMICISFDFPM
jgi:predicted ATPase with chaperone activity